MSDYFFRIEAWKKKFKSLLSTFSTNIKELKKNKPLFAQKEGYVVDGGIHQCMNLPQTICECLQISFVV